MPKKTTKKTIKKTESAKEKAEEKSFREELVAQMSKLATSGFGLVAALAWNEAVQEFVAEFIEPRIPGSGLAYKFIYAVLITILIVLVTYYLSKISARFQRNKD